MVIAVLIVLGLCFGSFVNALVWRLHEQELPKKKRAASDKDLSIATGRSMCPRCKHTLAWYDLLPVLSWLSTGGRCRYCKQPISKQYPIVELVTAALFVFSYLFWPLELDGQGIFDLSIWLVAITAFMALIIYDYRWMLLPNKIVYPLITVAGLQRLVDTLVFGASWSTLLASIGAALVSGGIFYVLYQVSSGNWIGGGDVKLGFALGFLVGTPVLGLFLLMLASFMGLVWVVPSLLRGTLKKNLQIPFGPCLMAACFVLVLFGSQVVDWYMNLLLFNL